MPPPGSSPVRVVVTDANILINLIHVGRLDLLGKLPPYSFVVSRRGSKGSERSEPSGSPSDSPLLGAPSSGAAHGPSGIDSVCRPHPDPGLRRSGMLEPGAVPASGSSPPTKRRNSAAKTLARLGAGRLLNTPGILTLAISSGILTVEDADRAKVVLEQHRFHHEFSFLSRGSSPIVSTSGARLILPINQ